jgi:tetratricopeptide (TPR) repeat protein
MRRIVFIGNCQIHVLSQLYSRFAAAGTHDCVEYIPSYQDLSSNHRTAIEQADVVVDQVLDFKPKADAGGVPSRATRCYVPVITAAFLWPFTGQPHPSNRAYPFLDLGPFPPGIGDTYLNRLMSKGVSPEEAVETYLALDVNAEAHLDRLYELVMEKQRARDEATGFATADLIESHFRTEPVFLAPFHPNTRLTASWARQFFERMDVAAADTDRMMRSLKVTPFPLDELPIHPSVARHFGLTYVTDDRLYAVRNEGRLTLREYLLRYLRYDWNEPLEEGIALSTTKDLATAKCKLLAGLTRSPHSGAGHAALSHVLGRLGQTADAMAAIRKAIELEPDHAPNQMRLGSLMSQLGDLDAAARALREAIRLDLRCDPHYRSLLANLLRRAGKFAEARPVIDDGLACDPYFSNLYTELGHACERAGDDAAAEAAFAKAVDLAQDFAPSRIAFAQFLSRHGRTEDAIAMARTAVELDPGNAGIHALCADIFQMSGDLPGAVSAVRAAIALEPKNARLKHRLSQFLAQGGYVDDAIAAVRDAIALDSANARWHSHLGHLLFRGGDLHGAKDALNAALALDPNVTDSGPTLNMVLERIGREDATSVRQS